MSVKKSPRFWSQCALTEMWQAPERMIRKGVMNGVPEGDIRDEFRRRLAELFAAMAKTQEIDPEPSSAANENRTEGQKCRSRYPAQ